MTPSLALGGSSTSGSMQGSPRASSKPPTPTSVASLSTNRNSSRSPAAGGGRGTLGGGGAGAASAAPLTRADLVREHSRRELRQRQQRLESPLEEDDDVEKRTKNGERQQVSVFFLGGGRVGLGFGFWFWVSFGCSFGMYLGLFLFLSCFLVRVLILVVDLCLFSQLVFGFLAWFWVMG